MTNKRLIFIMLLLLFIGGCGPLEWLLTDISGWDLSACVSGYDTCWELFMDNKDNIFGGETAINNILNF